MFEGPIDEKGYCFPGDNIANYLNSLPDTNFNDNVILDYNDDPIVIMTHDDIFDSDMHEYEIDHKYKSSWFIDNTINEKYNKYLNIPKHLDIGIHFNKETSTIQTQIKKFEETFQISPTINRNHRLLF